MTLRFVFVMDPIERINIHGDSTFVLMLESQRRGHGVLYCQPKDLELRGGRVWAEVQPARLQRVVGAHVELGAPEWVELGRVDAVFVRKDPPFDLDYLLHTYLLDHVDRRRVVMINDPRGIRDFNEKIAAFYFADLMPRTVVTANRARIRELIELEGGVVVKPLTSSGGSGVIHLVRGDKNIGSVLDLLTREGRTFIEAQAYLPRVVEGDKRIVLLDGEPIGAVNRRPRADDLRANMHVGGVAEPAMLTEREREICRRLAPELRARGLVFVGIDVIDGHLTEINVTSPTGLQEIGRFDGSPLEARYVDWIEERRATLG